MKQYFIKTLNGMGLGLFSSLVIGTILQQIGILTNISLLQTIGIMAKNMMGAAIGVLSARVFAIKSNSTGAGMGTSGLVGQIQVIDVMGTNALLPILLLHFILPALISIIISEYMRKKGYIKLNDMKLYKID